MVGARGWGWGREMENSCLMGTDFQFGKMKKGSGSSDGGGGNACTTV